MHPKTASTASFFLPPTALARKYEYAMPWLLRRAELGPDDSSTATNDGRYRQFDGY